MIYFIVYDISHTNHRNRIIDVLKDYGFKRQQKSVFLGELSIKDYQVFNNELKEKFKSKYSTNKDILFIIPVCTSCCTKIDTM